MSEMFFTSWLAVVRVLIVGTCGYAALVLLLRVTGKRTLTKLNAFDLIVTVALGSTLASLLLSKATALVDGVMAFATLVLLQWIVTWLSVRCGWFSRIVKSEPRLLYFQGQFLDGAMHQERVREEEVLAGVREQGISQLDQVEAVVLETSGELSVIRRSDGPSTSLRHVAGRADLQEAP